MNAFQSKISMIIAQKYNIKYHSNCYTLQNQAKFKSIIQKYIYSENVGRKNKKMMNTNSGEHLLLGEEGEYRQEGKLKGNLKIFLFVFHKLRDFISLEHFNL